MYVLAALSWLFLVRGVQVQIRSDNGSEFTAAKVRQWLERMEVRPLFIEPGSPWENGYIESFNGKLRDELLDREIFYNLPEARVLIEDWRRHYNTQRPHSALGYRPPAPEATMVFPPTIWPRDQLNGWYILLGQVNPLQLQFSDDAAFVCTANMLTTIKYGTLSNHTD